MNKNIHIYGVSFPKIGIFFSILLLFIVLSYDILFQWFHPDDLAAIIAGNQFGYFGCVENYFLKTTLNRLTSDAIVCTFNLIYYTGSPFSGLVLLRLLLLLTIPLSLSIVFNRYIFPGNFIYSFASGIIISSISLAIIYSEYSTLFPLDLVMYCVSASSFILLLYAYLGINESIKKYLLFVIIFFLSANTHEIIMALCGMMLLKFAFDIYKNNSNKNDTYFIRMKKIISFQISIPAILLVISFLMSILTPGYKARIGVWPIDLNYINIFHFIFLNIEEYIYLIYLFSPLIFILFLIGLLFSIIKDNINKDTVLYLLKLFSIFGILYALIVILMVGMVPSLYILGTRTPSFQLYESFFNLKPFSVPTRSIFFTILFFNISVFLTGIYVGLHVKKRKYVNSINYIIIILILFLSFIHPDIKSSVSMLIKLYRPLSSSLSKEIDSFNLKYNTSNFDNKFITGEIFSERLLSKKDVKIQSFFYNRTSSLLTPSFELNILGDKILNNVSLEVSRDNQILKKIENSLRYPYQFRLNSMYWYENTYKLYLKNLSNLDKIYMGEVECSFNNFEESSKIKCLNPMIEKTGLNLTSNNLELTRIDLNQFNQLNLVDIIPNNNGNCIEVLDNKNIVGEHFAATSLNIQAGKTLFLFNGLKSSASSYVYLIGSNSSVLVPWSNHTSKSNIPAVHGDQNVFKILFLQTGNYENKTYLSLIVESQADQVATLRLQNSLYDVSKDSTTVYKVDIDNSSITCGVKIGRLTK